MRLFPVVLLLCALLCSGCQPASTHSEAYVFGTLVEIQIDGAAAAQAQAASDAVLQRYQQLHQQLHAWQAGELSQLNAALSSQPAGTVSTVSPRLAGLLRHAQQLSLQSGGLFNPAIGQLVTLWGFHRDQFSPVQIVPRQLQHLVAQQASMADIQISGQHVRSRNPAVEIDLGGYAKGYALDEGIQILKAHGIRHALINVGGNVMALGTHHGRPWRVGIQHPRQPGAMAAIDLDDGWAIGTSGDYQRYYIDKGVRYCHILDPRTGKPASQVQSATVLIAPQAHTGVLSDVASKPLFIEPGKAATLARNMQVEAWLLVTQSGEFRLNRAMHRRLQWLDTKAAEHAQVVE